MTPAPTLQDLIGSVRTDAGSDDPLELLSTAVGMASDLDTVKDELLGYFVDRCRGNGKSWTEISAALGVTRQAAHRRFNVSDPSLERFTDRTRRVVVQAPEIARSLRHNYVGTEHLLLAIFTEPESVAARVLAEREVTQQGVEAAIRIASPRGETEPVGGIPYTPRAATVLTGAVTSAIELGHNYVGTEHLLLALLRDPDALSAKILNAHQVSIDDARQRIIEILSGMQVGTLSTAADGAWVAQALASGAAVDMFNRFTDAARDLIVHAQEEARELQHTYLGTEHLLLACFIDDTAASRVLAELGLTKTQARDDVVAIVGTGPRVVQGPIPFTPRARLRVERALTEATDLGDAMVAPEHLLLALVSGNDLGVAARVLAGHGGTRGRILALFPATRDAD